MTMSVPAKKPKNVFAAMGKKKTGEKKKEGVRPMSEAERIMKEELERKRIRSGPDNNGVKRQRVA